MYQFIVPVAQLNLNLNSISTPTRIHAFSIDKIRLNNTVDIQHIIIEYQYDVKIFICTKLSELQNQVAQINNECQK